MAKALPLVLLGMLHARGAAVFTYPDLVHRLTDLEMLSILPDSGEGSAQWTSRDRAARYDSVAGSYLSWAANGDGDGFLGDNGDGGKVMARMSGPGCIWRIWTARANSGSVKIFLDGSTVPAVDLPFSRYFDRSRSPFDYESLVYAAAGGWNNYVPIPYKSSCKVVAYGDWGAYYHIGYSTFPAGTVTPAFTLDLPPESKDALAKADACFKTALGKDPAGPRPGQRVAAWTNAIAAGGQAVVFTTAGSGAITGIRIKVEGLSGRSDAWAALRQLTVSMHWDGEALPSVWAPLGDFFGTAAGLTPFHSLPTGLEEDGWFYAYWYMPYASGAKVVLQNDGPASRALRAEITTAPLTRDISTLARFHAKWNRNAFPIDRADRWPDYSVLKTSGRGRFLGFMLHLYKPGDVADPKSSPGEYWWGEGDEKFFVDGGKEPSWFGTGSEDYFGYAWATPDYFSKPFHTQLFIEGGIHWKGNRCLNRFQITDNVPFQRAFEADIEKYYSDDHARYAAMPYWYLEAGGKDGYAAVSLAERTGYYESPAPRDTGRIEGEDLAILSMSPGSLVVQDMAAMGKYWSNGKQIFWYKNNLGDVQAGGVARLAFPVNRGGQVGFRAVLTKASDYGAVQAHLDGVPCGSPVDLYDSRVTVTSETELCKADLSEGTHELRITVTGKNPASTGYYMGIDYLRLVPIATGILNPSSVHPAIPLLGPISIRQGGIRCQVAPQAESACIFDLRGVRLRALVPSEGEVVWDGRDGEGRQVRGGTYLLRVSAGLERRVRSFILMP